MVGSYRTEARIADILSALASKLHLRYSVALLLLGIVSILYRLPALLNAAGVHSDAAIVGLQAEHILRGEWYWLLWGTSYQGSFDALLIALAFAITGPSPLTLMLVPLIGYLLLVWFVFDVLRERLNVTLAVISALVVVFTPYAINGVTLYAPRQWCITCVIAAVWLLDGARESRAPLLRYALGAMIGALSVYLDLFALQFVPGLAVFALACSLDARPPRSLALRRTVACIAGFALGFFLTWLLRRSAPSAEVEGLSFSRIAANFDLLWNACLPWLLGYKVYVPWVDFFNPQPWEAPALFRALQIVGAASLAVGILLGGLATFVRSVPWTVRRLGLLGFIVSACSILGFLVSVMPTDAWAARYLAPIVWTAPFALAPTAYRLRSWRFAAAVTPYLIVAAVGGWLSFGLYLHGPFPIMHPRGVASEEARLGQVLRAKGVTYASADYWLAYRLTFLWGENPIVTPLNTPLHYQGFRYAPYQDAFDTSPVVAFIFHPWVPSAAPEPYEAWLRGLGVPYERVQVADFTALIVRRRPCELMTPDLLASEGLSACPG